MTPRTEKIANIAIWIFFAGSIAFIVGFAIQFEYDRRHMDDKEKWGNAFEAARFKGVPTFVFNGVTYSTETGQKVNP